MIMRRLFLTFLLSSFIASLPLPVVATTSRNDAVHAGSHSAEVNYRVYNSTAMFVFGDSISDVGNNQYGPPEITKNAFHLPNGLDYIPGSGRFSNGRVWVDFVGKL